MYYQRVVLQAIGAGTIAGVTGCSAVGLQEAEKNEGPRTVTDDASRDISLRGAVERAVAVGPGALRQVA